MKHLKKYITVAWMVACSLLSLSSKAQSEQSFVKQVVDLQLQFNDIGALQLANKGLEKYPQSYELLANASFLHTTLAINHTDKVAQEKHLNQANAIANKLIEIFPSRSLSYTAKATALGGMAITQPARRKIDFAYEIKDHIDKAISLDKNNALAWHVLGRWSYEMASLGRTERFFAGILYRPIPQASMNDAVKYLYKSYTLRKDFVPNYLFLALAYKKLHNTQQANYFINQGVALPPQFINDRKIIAQLKQLQKKI